MKSYAKVVFVLTCVISFLFTSGIHAQTDSLTDYQSRLCFYGGVHGSKITGTMSDLIDHTDSASNDKVIYGLGIQLGYFLHQ